MGKKLISMLLIGLMTIIPLTACGTNEIGYFELSKEINDIKQYEFNNTTKIYVPEELAGESYDIDFKLEGEVNLEDLDSIYLDMNADIKVNDVENNLPINLVVSDNKMYVSKAIILEVLKLSEEFGSEPENKEVMDALYNVELKDVEYIMLYDFGEYYSENYSSFYEDIYASKDIYEDMYDPSINYLKTAFKGFDSDLVKKISGGYSIELDPENAVEFIKKLVKYADENRETIFDETVKYVEGIFDYISADQMGISEEEKEEFLEELKGSRQDYYDFLDEAVLFIEADIETDEFKKSMEMVDGSSIKEEIYKKGKSYIQAIEGSLVLEGVNSGNFELKTEVTPADVEKKELPEDSITVDEFEKLHNATEDRINPVNKIELTWYPESYSADIVKYRLDNTSEYDYETYTLIDERVYLPLRYIGESFGEEVEWDDANKKAYIVRDGQKTDMTGVLVDSTTMVKIRDFEKLGYKIDYIQEDGISTATIIK
ncbi:MULTISPECIES: copper amine oxidase N-terminal domain-containing protein [unclassified Sedimentibacter]|uniref:copper amine oxidase N-terminal domain-containing protein n=1 Tax=unclassified Sedimentibacter TaxID=2649220 RepID=UPI0027E1ABA6|nr:copper amine oxidase N-terminal domain-containing protein [Sedimentibacter sp. MB35-C1]WMJ78231.1 copper amine oxidase N-terminal domain-containing protein [Sedimentibacter sp. MB35-C1]